MKKALVVGLNKYPNGNSLSGCVNDADEIAKRLSRHGNGDKNFDVKKLTDAQVDTKGKLKGAIQDCFSGNYDVSLFYFSGHGLIDAIGGYIVTPDYTKNDVGVSMEEILTIVNNSTCRNKIVILDCCHAGFMGSITSTGQTSVIQDGVTILTASKSNESAVEINGHGVFTELLLAALDGEAADLVGNITPGGVYAFIDKSLGAWEQRPVFKTNVTTFSPLRKVTPPINIEILRNLANHFTSSESAFHLDPSYEYTNTNDVLHKIIEPYASSEHTRIMKELQQLERVGLVVPCGTEHMYYAAMDSKSCQLTAVGKHYWRLAKGGRI